MRFFADPSELIADTYETIGNNHGRLERRRSSVCHDVTWLTSDRPYPDEPRMPHLAMIGLARCRAAQRRAMS